MGYAFPAKTTRVSDSWAGHRNRPTPSQEPGTDYATAYGEELYAVESGTVAHTKSDSGTATGRFVTIDLDDGRRVRYLHLSSVGVRTGQRVKRGQVIGRSGASANGRDWGVGSHVHVTLFPSHQYVFGPNGSIDFEKYVGGGVPAGAISKEEDDMFSDQDRADLAFVKRRLTELNGDSISAAVWGRGGTGDLLKRTAQRVLATYDSMRHGKKGVRTTGSGLADLQNRMGRVELQNEALLATVKTLADAKGVDGEAIVQQVARSVDKALADVSITLSTEKG